MQWKNGVKFKDVRLQKERVQYSTPFRYELGKGKQIRQVCSIALKSDKIASLENFIKHKMTYRLYLDGLPSAVILKRNPKKHTEIL